LSNAYARLLEQRREGEPRRGTAGQRHRACEHAEERRRTDQPRSDDADDVLHDGADGRQKEKPDDERPSDFQKRNARAEADRREERDHQRVAEGRVEADERHPAHPADENRRGHDETADDGGGDVVARDRRNKPFDAVPEEEHQPGERNRLHQIQRNERRGRCGSGTLHV
jgi:hypothetical protein